MGAFKVLMWKHFTVRRRRLIQTLVELIAPVLVVIVLFFLRTSMREKHAVQRFGTLERFSFDSTEVPPRIYIHPDTNVTRLLMTTATRQDLPTVKALSKLEAVKDTHPHNPNITSLKSAYEHNDVVVVFENITGDKLPEKLVYTIKVGPSIRRSEIPQLFIQHAIENFDAPTLRLQWAIDSAFLRLKSHDTTKLKITTAFEQARAFECMNSVSIYRVVLIGLAKLIKEIKRSYWWISNTFLTQISNGNTAFSSSPSIIQDISFEELADVPFKAVNYLYVNSLFYLIPYVCFLSPMLPFIFLMTRLLEERSAGIQELVKMVGVTPAMLGFTQYLNTLPTVLVFCVLSTILFKCTDEPMITSTNPIILFTGLFLHFNTIIAFAYACSYLVGDAQYTVSLAMFIYIGIWIPIRLLEPGGKSSHTRFLLGLLPHCPSYWFVNEMHTTEVYYEHIGITFENWDKQYGLYKDGSRNATVIVSFIMSLVQLFYAYLISWYLEKVIPGKYGIALPWNFLCQKEYWRRKHKIPDKSGEFALDPAYQKFFEEPPSNMEAGIKISHISKIFGSGKKKFQALKNVNLDVYKGEITVLLGHNGAGKTTLMSIITGMINPTSGKVYVNGMDTVTQQAEVRKHLGLCPQHNLFFPDLTVLEHFVFFSMIKGGSFRDARNSSKALMEQLDLSHKANCKTSELSGGMLRRMQLGCALCGNASVLILDEPTSGLDVEARRELWDMLLALRGDRTLLLTTHFMEEADVLGDRLAALHEGELRCHATPMFLKRAVGSGFRMYTTTIGVPDEDKITQRVHEIVPDAKVKENTLNSVVYDLPAGANLPALFSDIENRKEELNIESLGVGITTLEEVFLELCCDVDTELKAQGDVTDRSEKQQSIGGISLIFRQMRALFRRQFDFTMSKKVGFIVLQVLLPFIMCISLTELFNNEDISPYARFQDLDMFTDIGPANVLYRIKGNENGENMINVIRRQYPKFRFTNISDLHDPSCTCRKSRSKDFADYILGVDINGTTAKVLYRPSLKHAASTGLNLLSNILAVENINADGKTINLKMTDDWNRYQGVRFHIPKQKMNCVLFATFNIFIIMATAVNDVTLPCRERLTVARHTHVMAGCPPVLYWLTTFLYHMCTFTLFCCVAALVAAATMDHDKTIDDWQTLGSYAVALVLSGADFYAFAYFVSYYFTERGASMLLIAFTIIFGFFNPILMMALDDLRTSAEDPQPMYNRIMNVIGIFLPAHVFTQAVTKMTDTSRFNSFCKHNFDYCPGLPYYSAGFDNKVCCSEGSKTYGPFNHFAFTKFAMGWSVIIILFQFSIFTTLVLLLEYGYCNRWWNSIGRKRTTYYPPKLYNDAQVEDEKRYVAETVEKPREKITDSLLISEAWKTYYRLCGKPTYALKNVNFSVRKGECFGLLGVNGAGKTTTFKLISYEESATKGRIYVNGHFLSKNSTQYMRGLGYCPQFCGLDDFRPGADNLKMLLILRGFTDKDVKRETAAWMEVVGMSKYGHRPSKGYSGGMIRRLATATSLCSGSPVTLLDEPTAGVDTAARRLVWAALRRGLLNDRAIVFASNNMDELELLCGRVSVLSGGEQAALGAPKALRDARAPGHSAIIKLRHALAYTGSGKVRVEELRKAMENKFKCTLKDAHITSLHYRINEKLLYSDIFTRMEEIEKEYEDIVEDYSVSDTTLEDVFLTLANVNDNRK